MSDAISKSRLDNAASDAKLRYADVQTAKQYPFACQTQPLTFQPLPLDDNAGDWEVEIDLPPIPADSVVIPSYTQLGEHNYGTQFTLCGSPGISSLPCVPSVTQKPRTSTAVTTSQLDGISTHIDYWLTAKQQSALKLKLRLSGAKPDPRYLLNVCIRPQQLTGALSLAPLATDRLLGQSQPVRPLSQRLGPNAIRGGICSPTATAMAMRQLSPGAALSWPSFVAACRDGATGMYGVWPLNLYQASRLGHLGAIETLTQATQIKGVLEAQLPLVASIKYAKGALLDAPQPQTSGHLVMLHGIDNGYALVSDPAAPAVAAVCRQYPLEQFMEAWLRNRGACYLMLPKA